MPTRAGARALVGTLIVIVVASACSAPPHGAAPPPRIGPSSTVTSGSLPPRTTVVTTAPPAAAPPSGALVPTIAPTSLVPSVPAATGPAEAKPQRIYGVTVDDVSNFDGVAASLAHFSRRPTTRVVFDVGATAGDHESAIARLHGVSDLMGLLLDSSDEQRISAGAEHARVASFLAAYGSTIDIWEVGNEVNGNWLGDAGDVVAKLVDAYTQAAALGKRTALTLYDNIGCSDGPSELGPVEFSSARVPPGVRAGLSYVLLSYYEAQCNGARPSPASLASLFTQLHALYPNALLGFGEVGLPGPVTPSTLATAEAVIAYYYGLRVDVPGYVGGCFWWYFAEDAVPFASSPVWRALNAAFTRS
jgi:hypothetical protein